jgi:hypothetical protein
MFQRRLLIAVAAACVASVAIPSTATPAVASGPVVFQASDTSPDQPGAPDISSVTVSDTTQGLITIQIAFVSGTEHLPGDSYGVYIDSDQNPTTGDLSGAGTDYLMQYDSTEGGGLGLYKWDGKSSYAPASRPSLHGSFVGDNQYFVFAASDLGITDGFNFNVVAAVGSDPSTSSVVDFVPDTQTNLHYSMQNKAKAAAVSLSITDWSLNVPHAGKYFGIGLAVKRSDTGALLGNGRIGCTLNVGGRTVPAALKRFTKFPWYKGGAKLAAVCAWRIPVGSAGATATAKETVTLGTSTVSKTFVERIGK